jgi:hypothetical protein
MMRQCTGLVWQLILFCRSLLERTLGFVECLLGAALSTTSSTVPLTPCAIAKRARIFTFAFPSVLAIPATTPGSFSTAIVELLRLGRSHFSLKCGEVSASAHCGTVSCSYLTAAPDLTGAPTCRNHGVPPQALAYSFVTRTS